LAVISGDHQTDASAQVPLFVLVHSPLVGPSTWEPVADELIEDDALTAQARGWAVDRAEAGHLHTVVEPVDVANRILGLLARLGVVPR
jgi:hypothetical protein